jgi:hypothetical protein
MPFKIRMGVPEMADYWADLSTRKLKGLLETEEEKFFKRLVTVLRFLEGNPRYPSLNTHEIDELSAKYGFKVFEAYVENQAPAAGRLFWAYGPEKGEITILGIEPHPDDKKGAYTRIKLSALPSSTSKALKRKPS